MAVAAVTKPKTVARVSSFNVLGATHTDGDTGDKHGYEPGVVRAKLAADFIKERRLSIIGTQENQNPQVKVLDKELTNYDFFGYDDNSIWWDARDWDMLQHGGLSIPYFDGKHKTMPYVLLQHQKTEQKLWVYNAHNPADVKGAAGKWRREGWALETSLYTELRREVKAPILSVGDKNAISDYIDHMPRRLHPASKRTIDFICGTPRLKFTDAEEIRGEKVRKITDHKVSVATMTIV